MPTKKEEKMQLTVAHPNQLPPLPHAEEKQLVQAEVNQDLYDQMIREMKRSDIKKIRTVIEYGIACFVARSQAEAGIHAKPKKT